MIYVFDTSSLSKLKHFYPDVFKSVWLGIDGQVGSGKLISTREVWNELERGDPGQHVNQWLKDRKHIFTTPGIEELMFVSKIFEVKHFQALIGEQQRLKGTPVADPFVIACAHVNNGVVVTEEKYKENAAKIPNVCAHFGIGCVDLETYMKAQGWSF
ncbi:MAG: DUF4411 family protein [Chromatiales bacterium]|nr:DUF4411 family protein [Chromatiales bacterium]